MRENYQDVFIIGSKGIPANYGGYETFVDQIVINQKNSLIHYHVACMNQVGDKTYHNARCFGVKVPNIGPAKAVYYDLKALHDIYCYAKKNHLRGGIIYVLACRIGPFFNHYKKKFKRLGFQIYVNPDGHEWKRSKWNYWIRQYWKLSERLMVKHADLLVCDSVNIEKYIQKNYAKYHPKTTFLAYGADTTKSTLESNAESLKQWYDKFDIQEKKYYLIVGRFVPENNYETMIREFMKSNTEKDLVIVTNISQNSFYKTLREKTKFYNDKRIKFVGTVYDKELIKKIRENAYGYFHGHEVGGTNPSLLEALASTDLNLLLQVGFNEEVAQAGALYWNKESGNLSNLINQVDQFTEKQIKDLAKCAKERIKTSYSWDYIIQQYEKLFLRGR